jgi:hypothetical protein
MSNPPARKLRRIGGNTVQECKCLWQFCGSSLLAWRMQREPQKKPARMRSCLRLVRMNKMSRGLLEFAAAAFFSSSAALLSHARWTTFYFVSLRQYWFVFRPLIPLFIDYLAPDRWSASCEWLVLKMQEWRAEKDVSPKNHLVRRRHDESQEFMQSEVFNFFSQCDTKKIKDVSRQLEQLDTSAGTLSTTWLYASRYRRLNDVSHLWQKVRWNHNGSSGEWIIWALLRSTLYLRFYLIQ